MWNKSDINQTSNAAESSAPELLERLIHQAEQAGANDVHLQMCGDIAEVAFRLDGVVSPVTSLPAKQIEPALREFPIDGILRAE